jgi:hypothetical protein
VNSDSSSTGRGSDAAVKLKATSPWGPFAAGTVALKPSKALVRNGTDGALVVTSAVVSPLVDEQNGLAAEAGEVTARVAPGALPPGGSAEVILGGATPARPGRYRAQLDLKFEGGEPIPTPLRVEVAASAFWGVLCLLLGLSLLGIVKLLTHQGDVEELARQAHRERAATRADWERNPPPASLADTVAEIERDYDDALRSLAPWQGFSVVDRRTANASAFLADARSADAKLRDAMTAPEGVMEVADLEREWTAFKSLLAGLAAPTPTSAAPPPQGLGAHVGALIDGLRERLVAAPARAIVAELEPHVERVRLAMAAGQGPRAREMAIATRAWQQRAADDLEKRQALAMGFALLGADLLAIETRLRRLAADESIPPEARAKWIASLDAADAKLAAGLTLENFRQANELAQDAETRSMLDQKEALTARAREAAEAVGGELSLDAVGAAFAEMGPPGKLSDADYAAGMAKVFKAWRAALGPSTDEESRRTIQTTADSGIAAAKRQDLPGIKQAYSALKTEWSAYTAKYISAAVARAAAPICADWRDAVLARTAVAAEQAKLQSGRSEVEAWEKGLDRARLALLAISTADPDCIGKVADTYKDETISVSKAAYEHVLEDAGIPLDARLDAAERSGDAAAVALVQRLMTAPRDLKLGVTTKEEDVVVDQPIHFAFANLDPNWSGPAVDVLVDWGDGSEPLRTTAEKLLGSERPEHAYEEINTYTLKAAAMLGERKVGESVLALAVKPSPANFAQRLADIFLTSQFALALLIASVVYFWRFHAGTVVFGSESLHYVQAFALGVAAYAAVADLPKALGELALK